MEQAALTRNTWESLKQYTAARIAIGRAGCGLPTEAWLQFRMSHAIAKDAVWLPFHKEQIADNLKSIGLDSLFVESRAANRREYLTRPDLGRRLSEESVKRLTETNFSQADVLLVIGDGLSSTAIHSHAIPFIEHLMIYLSDLKKTLFPVIISENTRVALGDEIGQLLGAAVVVMLIGERPGLSSPDSMGIYLTWKPTLGTPDSERNCISNIRPEGLNYNRAAFKLAWLIENAYRLNRTGIMLKDMSDDEACGRIIQFKPLIQQKEN